MSLRSLLKEIFPDGSSLMGERPLLFGYGQGVLYRLGGLHCGLEPETR